METDLINYIEGLTPEQRAMYHRAEAWLAKSERLTSQYHPEYHAYWARGEPIPARLQRASDVTWMLRSRAFALLALLPEGPA